MVSLIDTLCQSRIVSAPPEREVVRCLVRSNVLLSHGTATNLSSGLQPGFSGCANQKDLSLEDQIDHGKQLVGEMYDGAVDYRVIATEGKGERLDRPELAQIEAVLRSRELDLLIVEDIGRPIRGGEAVRPCGVAVDHGVRVLAPNDGIDTNDDTWEEDVLSACQDHVGHNAHTSKRLKQKLMNRFVKFGGATAREIYGVIKPPGATKYGEWLKDTDATSNIQEGTDVLKATLNCSAVADLFNRKNVPTGKYCRSQKWDGRMVRRFYRNPMLIGKPGRGFRHTVKHHETGRRISEKNPKGPVFQSFPHLAQLDPIEFDELNARLTAANESRSRKKVDGLDPLLRRPRRRTRFPGQMVYCGICGHLLVFGGHGQNAHLICQGARDYTCRNGITADGPLSARKVANAVQDEIESLPDFDTAFLQMVNEEAHRLDGAHEARCAELATQAVRLNGQIGHLTEFVLGGDTSPRIREELNIRRARIGDGER